MAQDNTEARESERTCVGCRETADREELMRLVLDPTGRVVPDIARKLPGRGASVHPRSACLKLACTRGGLSRAFSRQINVNPSELGKLAHDLYERRLEGLLLAASRTKGAAVGTEAVRDALRTTDVALIVVAADAEGRREEILTRAEALGSRCFVFGTKASLGTLFRREELGILAIVDHGIAHAMNDVVQRMTSLSEDA